MKDAGLALLRAGLAWHFKRYASEQPEQQRAEYARAEEQAREAGLAGATVLKGVLGYGATDHIRTTKILDLSADLSMVVEIVDEESRIEAFQPTLSSFRRYYCPAA